MRPGGFPSKFLPSCFLISHTHLVAGFTLSTDFYTAAGNACACAPLSAPKTLETIFFGQIVQASPYVPLTLHYSRSLKASRPKG
jgi:hypothetical protein